MTTGRDSNQRWRSSALASLLACVVFALALLVPYAEFAEADWRESIPAFPRFDHELSWSEGFWKRAVGGDSRLHLFNAVGNARRMLEPGRALFDAGHCHPTKQSLALGEPLIALGLIACPIHGVVDDPVLTYNLALVASLLLAAMSMYFLIRDWTGDPVAGIVAGLLYAFHPVRVGSIVYPFINDTTGIVLALFFAGRMLRRGGWIHVLGFAAGIALQLATSFYPLVAAFLIALPFAVWWLHRVGLRALPVAPCVLAAIAIGLCAWWIYGPYLEVRQSLELEVRTQQQFATWASLAPSGRRFPGWLALALAIVAFAMPARSEVERRLDPRWPLLAGALLLLLTAVGMGAGAGAPPFFRLLGTLLPGLDAVRRPNEILTGMLLVVAALAGLGCARVRALAPAPARVRGADGVAWVVAVFFVTLRASAFSLEPVALYQALPVRPDAPQLAFFEELAREGNTGPIFEAPILQDARGSYLSTRRMVVSLYHERRTSACYSSYLPPIRDELRAIADALPDAEAFARMREMGFTTLIVNRALPGGDELAKQLERAARSPNAPVRPLLTGDELSAWAF